MQKWTVSAFVTTPETEKTESLGRHQLAEHIGHYSPFQRSEKLNQMTWAGMKQEVGPQ